ncbi:PAS domain-containing protein [Imhoffiella purpurea]|uniref:Signal transduction protein CetB, mediates an energy taxis response n=1 Tax=Imhoffiella purpurea TaxID=1249627 RepID=W9VI54_9GAMM|nr:PAS domain-containing protein [Imhoffiella purpurea]EXJ16691.1 Signal transduction protein CetB, mediates an energy taxis response [Imhoffiella purpurea]
MKNRVTPTSVERVMREDDFIVSKSDLKGRVTYGNRTFIEFSGFTEKDLLGSQHNIIRHPDMPRAVFALLWETIRGQREFNGYVKNMARDGSFYWVFANVTPDMDEERQVTGYFSVRRKPKASAVATISQLYRGMVEAERKAGPRDAIAASSKILQDSFREKGMTYDEFVLGL